MKITPQNPQPSALGRFVEMISGNGPHYEETALAVAQCDYVVPSRVASTLGIFRPASYAQCARAVLAGVEAGREVALQRDREEHPELYEEA